MKHTNVSGLKARLSEYLAAVRGGETVLVHDRRTPIARLVPANENVDDLQIVEPTHLVSELAKLKAVAVKRRVDVVRILRESRDQR